MVLKHIRTKTWIGVNNFHFRTRSLDFSNLSCFGSKAFLNFNFEHFCLGNPIIQLSMSKQKEFHKSRNDYVVFYVCF